MTGLEIGRENKLRRADSGHFTDKCLPAVELGDTPGGTADGEELASTLWRPF